MRSSRSIRPPSNKRLRLTRKSSCQSVRVLFWRRVACPSVDGQRCWGQLNRMSARRRTWSRRVGRRQ